MNFAIVTVPPPATDLNVQLTPIDISPPTTQIVIGQPHYIDPAGNTYVTSATSFTLTADDGPDGSGVSSTSYRIYNVTYDSGWLEYSAPFYLAGLSDGGYSIDCYSTDNVGNAEATNTTTVILENIYAVVSFDPHMLNLQSKGKWITGYVELSEGYDVAGINVSTILLNDTIPVDPDGPTTIGDYDGDGIPDLMVYFNRTQFVEYMLSSGIEYGNVTLALSGKLHDWEPFEGNAIIKVSSLAGDVNCDGAVDLYDLVTAAISHRSKEGEPNWNPNANYAPPWNHIDIFDIVTIASHYGKTYP
jgi:hypothetical protein